jgi:hypothetical protein
MTGNADHNASVSKVSLRRVLARLTALTLAVAPGASDAKSLAESQLRELEDEAEIDRGAVDSETAADALGRGLAVALTEMRPLAATELVATWSLSQDSLRRLAVGIALEWPFYLLGDGVVIDHLSRDGDPEIRAAAARAAWIRGRQGEHHTVLARLADDPDPAVRAIAHSARG